MTEARSRRAASSASAAADRFGQRTPPGAAPPRDPFVAAPRHDAADATTDVDIDAEAVEGEAAAEQPDEPAADAWGQTAEEVAENITDWLREHDDGDQSSNYTVAVLASHTIYISKVNGVTAATALIRQLGVAIRRNAPSLADNAISLRLCKRFNTVVGSNHGEMCVLAAIGRGNVDQITYFECTAPSCDYCREMCTDLQIDNLSPEDDPAAQSGWTHPFLPWAFGLQYENNHGNQVAALRALQAGTPPARAPLSVAPVGNSVEWDPAAG